MGKLGTSRKQFSSQTVPVLSGAHVKKAGGSEAHPCLQPTWKNRFLDRRVNSNMNDLKDIKSQLDRLEEMLRTIYEHFQIPETTPGTKIYQIKERARKKAFEFRKKLKLE
ncbi:MAG: hypothetical protein QXQ64_03025 [Candidatus Bathyarchaeia archaeon]